MKLIADGKRGTTRREFPVAYPAFGTRSSPGLCVLPSPGLCVLPEESALGRANGDLVEQKGREQDPGTLRTTTARKTVPFAIAAGQYSASTARRGFEG